MRVLLTGHLGYIGSVMTPMLQQAGHEVRASRRIESDETDDHLRLHEGALQGGRQQQAIEHEHVITRIEPQHIAQIVGMGGAERELGSPHQRMIQIKPGCTEIVARHGGC